MALTDRCGSCDKVITGEFFVVETSKGYIKTIPFHISPRECADQEPLRKEFHHHSKRGHIRSFSAQGYSRAWAWLYRVNGYSWYANYDMSVWFYGMGCQGNLWLRHRRSGHVLPRYGVRCLWYTSYRTYTWRLRGTRCRLMNTDAVSVTRLLYFPAA